jgi:shikimate kinase
MNIVLTGFMGTGKSEVGQQLAQDLHLPFFDIDTLIVKQTGKAVADIFSSQGEAAFRQLESRVIEKVSQNDRCVISTGGGALIAEKNREILERNGLLVCLTAKMSTLQERLRKDTGRPLLAGENLAERLEQLLKDRQALYDQCRFQIATDGKTISEVARDIAQAIKSEWHNA